MKLSFLFLFASLFYSSLLFSMNIGRLDFLGANQDGSRIAIFKSHFGASSEAPFASLEILEFGKKQAVFSLELFSFEGSEEKVQEMKETLLKQSAKALIEFGITSSTTKIDVDAIASNFDNQILIEADTRRSDRETTKINIRFEEKSNSNCESGKSLKATLNFINASTIENLKSANNLCDTRYWRYSKAFVVGQYLWLTLIAISEPMPDLFFGELVVHPIKNSI